MVGSVRHLQNFQTAVTDHFDVVARTYTVGLQIGDHEVQPVGARTQVKQVDAAAAVVLVASLFQYTTGGIHQLQ